MSNSSPFAAWSVIMLARSPSAFCSFSITSETWSRKPARVSKSARARTSSFRFSSRPGASGDLSAFHMSV